MPSPQPNHPQKKATLYTKLAVGLGSFIALVYFAFLHITAPEVNVPYWIFGMLIGIMGSTLGIDILAQTGTANRK